MASPFPSRERPRETERDRERPCAGTGLISQWAADQAGGTDDMPHVHGSLWLSWQISPPMLSPSASIEFTTGANACTNRPRSLSWRFSRLATPCKPVGGQPVDGLQGPFTLPRAARVSWSRVAIGAALPALFDSAWSGCRSLRAANRNPRTVWFARLGRRDGGSCAMRIVWIAGGIHAALRLRLRISGGIL
jgi:hypothetical protein